MTRTSYMQTRGFTLMEVLVALVVISIGVLGIAAMQASAIASTHSSQTESLVSIEARSLADAMQANPNYWYSGALPASFTVSGPASGSTSALGTVSDPTLGASMPNCASTACIAQDLAGYDLQTWGGQLTSLVPGATATIKCQVAQPVSCSIQVFWTQKSTTAINSGTQSTAAAVMSYTLVNQF